MDAATIKFLEETVEDLRELKSQVGLAQKRVELALAQARARELRSRVTETELAARPYA